MRQSDRARGPHEQGGREGGGGERDRERERERERAQGGEETVRKYVHGRPASKLYGGASTSVVLVCAQFS